VSLRWISAACLLLVLLRAAGSAEPPPWTVFDGCHWHFPGPCAEWRGWSCWCPDDYRPKCLPCVPPNPKGCVDDYCPKCLPCVPPNPEGCVDDYCPKCCPLVIPRCCGPACTCGPPEECHPGCCNGDRCKP
jgi:hypothetical protein